MVVIDEQILAEVDTADILDYSFKCKIIAKSSVEIELKWNYECKLSKLHGRNERVSEIIRL